MEENNIVVFVDVLDDGEQEGDVGFHFTFLIPLPAADSELDDLELALEVVLEDLLGVQQLGGYCTCGYYLYIMQLLEFIIGELEDLVYAQ